MNAQFVKKYHLHCSSKSIETWLVQQGVKHLLVEQGRPTEEIEAAMEKIAQESTEKTVTLSEAYFEYQMTGQMP